MANKDSTAVNRLIERSQQKSLDGDLDDLFGDESERQARKLAERTRAAADGTPRPEKVTAPPPRKTTQMVVPPMPATTLQPSAVPPPLPRGRVPASTQPPTSMPPMPAAAAPVTLPPLPKPSGTHALPRPSGPHAAVPPPRPARATAPPPSITPSAAPAGREPDSVTAPVDMGEFNAPWFQPSTPFARTDQSQEISFDDEGERRHSTRVVARPKRGRIGWVLVSAFVLGVGVAAVHMTVGIPGVPAIGGVGPAASVAAPVAAAAPVEAPSPSVAPAVEPVAVAPAVAPVAPAAQQAAVTALVMVTLTSQPAGANATLVDGSTTVSLGKTPLTTSLDPGRRHEVLFSLEGYATSLAVIDPSVATNVVVPLATAAAGAPTDAPLVAPLPEPAVVEPAPAAEPEPAVAVAEPTPAPKAKAKAKQPEPKAKPKQVAKADPAPKKDKPEPAAKGGAGILALGAKPPCEILIDGKSTGLTTPQREIKLPAGKHSVTLVNKGFSIKKTFSVSVVAGSPTKVLKDFSDEIK